MISSLTIIVEKWNDLGCEEVVKAMEFQLSKARIWAVLAGIVAVSLLVFGQWLLAIVATAIGGAGYVLARAIEDALDRHEESQFRRL